MRTLLPHCEMTASIINRHDRQTIQLNDDVVVSHPDLIVMDGVIHKIDRVLLPPRLEEESEEDGLLSFGSKIVRFLTWFWSWRRQDSEIGVVELMERLQPHLIE